MRDRMIRIIQEVETLEVNDQMSGICLLEGDIISTWCVIVTTGHDWSRARCRLLSSWYRDLSHAPAPLPRPSSCSSRVLISWRANYWPRDRRLSRPNREPFTSYTGCSHCLPHTPHLVSGAAHKNQYQQTFNVFIQIVQCI